MTTTPAPRDEYKDFDAWRKEQIAPLIRMGYPDAARAFNDLCFVQWAGWQARAERAALAESELAEVREQKDLAAHELEMLRDHHEACIKDAYQMLGIDGSDGEFRYRWVALEISGVVRERDELRAELERVKLDAQRYQVFRSTPSFGTSFGAASTPEQIDKLCDAAIDAARGVEG